MRNGLISGGGWIPMSVFAVGLLAAAVGDLRARRIPNRLVAPFLALGVAYHAILSGWGGVGRALAGVGLGIAILIVPFAGRLIGGGDVKLLGAIGAWMTAGPMPWVALWTAVLCGVLVLGLLVRHRALRRAVANNLTTAVLTHDIPTVEARPRAQSVPVGAAMASAALWVAIGERAFPLA